MEQNKKEQGKQSLLPSTITPQQLLTAGGAILTGGVMDLATHNMGASLIGAFATVAVGYLGGDVVRCVKYLVPGSDAREVVENTSRVVEAVVPTTLSCYTDQSTSAKLKRLFSLKSPQPEARPKEDENVTRVLSENATYASFDLDDEDDIATLPSQVRPQQKKDIFRFSELLNAGFVPTVNKIFVGRTMEGKDLFVAAEDLCHIALAGRTGGGKGSLMRLIMAQICYVGCKVLLLNPHYMRWVVAKDGSAFDEDWTPFEGKNPRTKTQRPYLEVPPVDCAEIPPIEQYLTWSVETLLHQRRIEGREGGKRFKPYFIVLDEWPSIADKIKEAPTHLANLLREGRKYGIFVIVASQDFQVKTIGMDGGSVRKCLLTTYYTGGDLTTAKELLNERVQDIPENELGKGVVLLRCQGVPKATLVRVPFVDNEAVYKLLGPSTFKKSVQKVPDLPQRVDRPVATDGATSLLPETIMVTPERFPDWFQNGQLVPSPYYEQTMAWQQQTQQQEAQRTPKQPTMVVQSEASNRMATDINLAMAVKVWNKVHPSVRDMEAIFDLNNNQARRLRKMIKEHPDAEQWDLSE